MKKTLVLSLAAVLLVTACGEKKPDPTPATITKIEATIVDDRTYLVGDKLEKSGIEVKAIYSDETSKAITDWTCDDFAPDYTVTAADGSKRSKEFTVKYNELTTKVSLDAFDGKVSVKEWDDALMYIYNGNDRKNEQNYSCYEYTDTKTESGLIDIDYCCGDAFKVVNAESDSFWGVQLKDGVYMHGFLRNGQYYYGQMNDESGSEGNYEDFNDLLFSELPDDPRSYDETNKCYSFEYDDFGTIHAAFEYYKGDVYLTDLDYTFEGASLRFFEFFDYGETVVELPDAINLHATEKVEGFPFYSSYCDYYEDEIKMYVFETTFVEDMVNPTFNFFPFFDDLSRCDISNCSYYYGEEIVKLGKGDMGDSGYTFDHTFKTGDKLTILINSIECPAEYEESWHSFTLRVVEDD